MKYSIPTAPIQSETVIKRSRFITHIAHAENRHDAEKFIAYLKKQHPQSNHVCWAYIAGPPNTTVMSMSDDGEPNGTAGKPMLNVLIHSGLGEVAAAVVRYFGGIKLGTGGLQRAYSNAVTEAIRNLSIEIKIPQQLFSISIPFAFESDIRYLLQTLSASIEQCHYQETITLTISIAQEHYLQCINDINNRTAGKACIKKLAPNKTRI